MEEGTKQKKQKNLCCMVHSPKQSKQSLSRKEPKPTIERLMCTYNEFKVESFTCRVHILNAKKFGASSRNVLLKSLNITLKKDKNYF